MEKMKGVTVPIITPFTSDDKVDIEGIVALVDYLVSNGIDSIYPNGTTGEMLKMSVDERKIVAETCIKASNGRIPVFVQVGAANLSDTLKLAEHAVAIGAAGIGVVTPQFFGVNHREMVNFYVTVANSVPVDFPVYLYNIPQCAGNDISISDVHEILSATKNVVGIKYSYPDLLRFNQYLSCGDGDFDVIVGPDKLFLPGLAIGCTGVVSGCAQCHPYPFTEVYRRFLAGDIKGAQQAQRQAIELADVVKAGANMGYFKAALEYHGVGHFYMRAPALDLTDDEKSSLFNALDEYHKKWG